MKKEILYHKNRPIFADWLNLVFDDFMEMHGDRAFGDDSAMTGGIACLQNRPVTVIGTAKGKGTKENIAKNFGMPHPEGYRKAMRLMRQAEKFKRPVITFVDTPGAFCGIGAEERGQGEAIARNLLEMMRLKTVIIAVMTGEGGSGGALGLAVADKILMLEEAMYSVISPRGCASILWKDPSREDEAAMRLKITAQDLLGFEIIEEIIPESGGAHLDPPKTASAIRMALLESLAELQYSDDLLERRYERFRKFGEFFE